ncbi:MAG: putative baseplate assembly protein [Anaerolineaceae bacterium]|nr:putative baseplate assembly protein [Anaerolineaceae bacterium]
MPNQTPKIDNRTIDDIVEQTEALAKKSGWNPAYGQGGPGRALIRIFSRMVELIIERLNQVPEKNFLAFLNLIGTQALPPQPARVPLSFLLSEGSKEAFLLPVPSGTQIAAPTEAEEIIFETERELGLTTAQLTSIIVHQPETDKYSQYNKEDINSESMSFPIFEGTTPIEHNLYLAHDKFFSLPGDKTITLSIISADAQELAELPIDWFYWNGTNWQILENISGIITGQQWEVTIPQMPIPELRMIDGREARWLNACQRVDRDDELPMPQIEQITVAVRIYKNNIAPELGLANQQPLDLSKDFYPFGEKPCFNDTFYLASQDVFSIPDAKVEVEVTPTLHKVVVTSSDLEIAWEIGSGQKWELIGKSTPEFESSGPRDFEFEDGTFAFTANRLVNFKLPSDIVMQTINGIESYWLRVRILAGNYGEEARYDKVGNNEIPYEYTPASFSPPSIAALKIGYTYEKAQEPLEACKSYNDFTFSEHTDDAKSAVSKFAPFKSSEKKRPTLYLGFDRQFANRNINIFAEMEPVSFSPQESADGNSVEEPEQIRLVWEYSHKSGWVHLGMQDDTNSLTENGLLSFIGPSDLEPCALFNQEQQLYWLRVRWEKGTYSSFPRLRRLLPNTTWASQRKTIEKEILGSSTGESDQKFRTAKSPVLMDPLIEVREPELPSVKEREIIKDSSGNGNITAAIKTEGQSDTYWVRWRQVPDFHGSGLRDRHYVLDYQTGIVCFGDGNHGMVPPRGRSNIRAVQYHTGGGEKGNLPHEKINQIKSTVPYIDGAINFIPASGGADQETLEQVKERGSKSLRHRDRVVTVQDFEDLAYKASSDVARTQAIFPHFHPTKGESINPGNLNPGQIGMIIVPYNNSQQSESKLIPSLGLIKRVRDYLLSHCSPTVDLWVAGPEWVEFTISTQIVPESLEGASALEEIISRKLQSFLHPLSGGPEGRGWAFGRKPHKSDLYVLMESLQGIDHIRTLEIHEETPKHPDQSLIYSGSHKIPIISGEEK